jgi:23S rRNA (guanine745-N1)-methyltransferase
MVRSRGRFLDRGHYAPLADRLVEVVARLAEARQADPFEALDSGCGEGYFLARLRKGLAQREIVARLRGIDVSRPAIQAAARRDRSVALAVASVHRLPVAPGALNLVLRVLAPLDAAEFRRVLVPGGHLLAVTPGPDHLLALRKLVYSTPRVRAAEPPPEGFGLVREEALTFPLRVESAEDLADLLAMTPYYWRARPEVRETIGRWAPLETTADLSLALYTSGRST